MTSSVRKAEIREIFQMLSHYPQIALVYRKIPCDGYRHSSMPLKAYSDPVLKETYRCRRNAKLHFSARKPIDPWEFESRSGNFCWQHFTSNLYGSDSEYRRFTLWWSRMIAPNESSDSPAFDVISI